jgi:hypothetical protein
VNNNFASLISLKKDERSEEKSAKLRVKISRDVNFFAFFAKCAQIAIAIANFRNRSAIAIGFEKKSQSQRNRNRFFQRAIFRKLRIARNLRFSRNLRFVTFC